MREYRNIFPFEMESYLEYVVSQSLRGKHLVRGYFLLQKFEASSKTCFYTLELYDRELAEGRSRRSFRKEIQSFGGKVLMRSGSLYLVSYPQPVASDEELKGWIKTYAVNSAWALFVTSLILEVILFFALKNSNYNESYYHYLYILFVSISFFGGSAFRAIFLSDKRRSQLPELPSRYMTLFFLILTSIY